MSDGRTAIPLDLHTNNVFTASMKQITIRTVKESAISKAKQRARERGVAMNTVLVEALEIGLGVHAEPSGNGLEKFAGDSDFGPDWDAKMEDLERVNPEDWK